jgi:hypothetical protein
MNRVLKSIVFIFTAVGLLSMYGCGGGGNSGPVTLNKAVVVLGTVLPSGSAEQIGSIDVTIELPDGVTVPHDSSSGAISNGPDGPLKLSGEAIRFAAQPNAVTPVILGKYTAATLTSKATVTMSMIVQPNNALGLNSGEFATLTCDRTPNTTIDTAAFKLISVLISNTTGTTVLYDSQTGVGPASSTISVTLQ